MGDIPALPERKIDAHKGNCGRVLIIAGSCGMTGAGALSSQAALRSGAGLVTWALPRSLVPIAETLTPEVITLPMPENSAQSIGIDAREYLSEAAREVDAVVIGPGMPVAGETGELLRLLIPEISTTLVIDAGGLTAIGPNVGLLKKRRHPTVLTPHSGEMTQLAGKSTDEIQNNREQLTQEIAEKSGAIVVLKGAGTVISNGKANFVNTSGNSGMATAGSGDVLSGVIAGLLAQKMEPTEAVRLAVYLHGLAGDIATEETGVYSLIASDILECLPQAFIKHAEDSGN